MPVPALTDELTAIWSDVLSGRAVGLDDDFFVLGGDSLQLINLVVLVSKRFGVDFDYDLFLQRPTIRCLATLIETNCKRSP